jgi:hypothetical protein
MLMGLVLLPFKVLSTIIKLLFKIALMPLKMVVGGLLLQLGMLLVLIAIIAALAYFAYHWFT